MDCIKAIHIEGYKKFQQLDITFNQNMNILVGENEAGKSTILDAIKTVFNQQYRNSDKSVLRELFNSHSVMLFKASPSTQTLPRILIEIELEIDPKHKNAEYFYGLVHQEGKTPRFGISFVCEFDAELGSGMEKEIASGKIPYEYYSLRWTTFAGRPYQTIKRPLNFLAIDTSSTETSSSFNYYNRTLFSSMYDENVRMRAKNSFRDRLDQAFTDIELPDISEHRKFGIDAKKVVLETILSVYEDEIPLENRGSGMESLIKTQIALDKRNSGLDVILIEEPENHLSFVNLRQMLAEISKRQESSQIIVATHSNMIASRLNLNNALWITSDGIKSLADVNSSVAEFFVQADDNGFLQLLLSTKTVLVEGATEFLLLPKFYYQLTGRTVEEDRITIISCNGISYKNYLAIAECTNKKVAVLTDNDHKAERIEAARTYNEAHAEQHIFMGNSVDEWTWEACVYSANKKALDSMIKVQSGAQYLFHNQDYGQVLGKMLNNKVDTAYFMLLSDVKYEAPQYVKDAISWLNE